MGGKFRTFLKVGQYLIMFIIVTIAFCLPISRTEYMVLEAIVAVMVGHSLLCGLTELVNILI